MYTPRLLYTLIGGGHLGSFYGLAMADAAAVTLWAHPLQWHFCTPWVSTQ